MSKGQKIALMEPTFILTHLGRKMKLDKMEKEDIRIEDIAHALSMVCRFGGHCARHYSVAEHSLLVAQMVPEEYKLSALLHDAAEAYLGDVVSPLKRIPQMDGYRQIERELESLIEEKYSVSFAGDRGIREADLKALYIEGRSFYGEAALEEWGFGQDILDWGRHSHRDILCYAPAQHKVKKEFMNAFLAYGGVK